MENDTTSKAYEMYAGHPGMTYEKYFVPAIGGPVARRVVGAAHLEGGERVVDLACGTGVAARLAAHEVGSTGKVTGIDPAPPMLEVARQAAPEIEWHQGRAEDLPLEDDSADAVICSQGYQFFSDKHLALSEIGRVLAPGGRVALGTPGPTPRAMAEIAAALEIHVGLEAAGFVHSVFAVHDPDQVLFELSEAGFEDVAAAYEPLPLHLPPPADFFWQYVNSTPLAQVVNQLGEARKLALQHEVEERCQPFVNAGVLEIAPGVLLATARHA